MKPKILCIVGPTASGKTSLALKVASLLPHCTIISVDARQIYQDLSILTGKDIPDSLPRGTNIYGTDILNQNEVSNIASFVRKIKPIISQSLVNQIPVILVGGSGLYLKALTSNLSDIYIPPDPKLRVRLSLLDLPQLQEELNKINPLLFSQLNHSDRLNPRRLIRHIEKTLAVKKSPVTSSPSADYLWVGLSLSKETQKKLIEDRVKKRIRDGAIDEVKQLLASNPNPNLPLFSGLGVKEIRLFLNQGISQEELVRLWTKSEIDYARRQMVWFNKQPSIIWYDESKDRDALAHGLANILIKK